MPGAPAPGGQLEQQASGSAAGKRAGAAGGAFDTKRFRRAASDPERKPRVLCTIKAKCTWHEGEAVKADPVFTACCRDLWQAVAGVLGGPGVYVPRPQPAPANADEADHRSLLLLNKTCTALEEKAVKDNAAVNDAFQRARTAVSEALKRMGSVNSYNPRRGAK